MTYSEVVKYLEEHGKSFKEFHNFMRGQTVGIDSDGNINYYKQDVYNFLRKPKVRFFD